MRKILSVALLALFSFAASAEVAPFGQVIGSASPDSVELDLSKRTRVVIGNPDEVTGEPILIAMGDGLGIEGLDKVAFIFNEDNVLVCALMMLRKSRYAEIVAGLKNKYPLVSEKDPFVGSRSATFREGDIAVIAEAKHMSHTMTVLYRTDEYFERASDMKRQQAQAKSSREESQL